LVTALTDIKNPMFTRPVWAEVSGGRLLANYEKLRAAASSEADLVAVIKADAYGHGALACAPLLAGAGAEWLGVTNAEEGAAVRAVCPLPRILLMSGVFAGEGELVIDQKLTPSVWEPWQIELLEAAGAARGLAAGSLAVHLEIDTGMSRQGVPLAELASVLARFHPQSCLRLEAVMTHFSTPEKMSSVHANAQVARLGAAVEMVVERGLRPRWISAGNSSSILTGGDREVLDCIAARAGTRLMLRPGLGLYGYADRFTRDGVSWEGGVELSPVMAWKTRVTSLRTLQVGETSGYGDTFVARGETRLALLPIGYADGLNRLLSNRGHVLVRGMAAPIAGRVSMDQTVVDVSGIPGVEIGDEVVLMGSQGEGSISAWDLADFSGSVPWEVLCAVSARVPRVLVG
jgi:alanine racemase